MPATAGRVRMPANNRVHSSAALQTHGIWQSAIGYDPYAPDQKQPAPDHGGESAVSGAEQNAYDSFQGLLALARLTGSNADEARGSCKKCGRVGHLTFQCRNFLAVKEEVVPTAAALMEREGGLKKDKANDGLTGPSEEESSDEESDLSDSSEDSEMERAVAAKFGTNVLKSSKSKGRGRKKERSEASKRRRSSKSHSKRSKSSRKSQSFSTDDSSEGESRRYKKHSKGRRKSKKRLRDSSESDSEGSGRHRKRKIIEKDSDREYERRKRRRRHTHRKSKRSGEYSESSEGEEGSGHARKKKYHVRHRDRKHD